MPSVDPRQDFPCAAGRAEVVTPSVSARTTSKVRPAVIDGVTGARRPRVPCNTLLLGRFARGLARSWDPEGAEVDDRVARAPALQEALDRRMQDDLVQLVGREQAVPADGGVVRSDGL